MGKTGVMKKFIGDKNFYKMILAIAVPIMIQNGITNFVGLLDNIMVGRIGTEQMSGAAIVNQLIFVYNLCIFGGVSGAGIFTAQYFGQKDNEGVRNTFRYKLWMALILTVGTVVVFLIGGEQLISMYLHGEGSVENLAATLAYGKQYLYIMLIGLPPFMMVQVYASTLRECGETVTPMKAGITAVVINLVFNYILIDPLTKDIVRKYKMACDSYENAEEESQDFLKKFAFICMLSFDVYVKKQVIEKLIDDMADSHK